jgi:hypothetical protein
MCHADVILASNDFVVMAVFLSHTVKSEKCEKGIKNV